MSEDGSDVFVGVEYWQMAVWVRVMSAQMAKSKDLEVFCDGVGIRQSEEEKTMFCSVLEDDLGWQYWP